MIYMVPSLALDEDVAFWSAGVVVACVPPASAGAVVASVEFGTTTEEVDGTDTGGVTVGAAGVVVAINGVVVPNVLVLIEHKPDA